MRSRTQNFKISFCYLCLATLVSGAEVSFLGDNKINGEIVSMDDQGTVTLNTSYASQALKVNVDKISKIDFGKSEQKFEIPTQNITLINGDSFPVGIRGLTEKSLQISSPIFGDIDVSREMIDSLEVGIFPKKHIYKGPNNINEWTSGTDEVSKWQIEDGALIANGSTLIYRDMKLPESYSIRFKLAWDANPNFRFSFGDPIEFSGKSVNRYYMQFARAGIEIKRESTGNNRFTPVAVIARPPDNFPGKELWIEIRLSRKGGRLELYLNDQLEGRYEDPHPDIPNGSGVTFLNQSRSENKIRISDIEVTEWEDRGDRHRTEDRGDGKEDAIIGRNGERFSGRLLSIADAEQGKVYRFKSNFQEETMDLPDSEVSNIFFSRKSEAKPEKFEGLNLFFQGRGVIQVKKCIFNENALIITHPLLGDLEINRHAATRLERHMVSKSKPETGK